MEGSRGQMAPALQSSRASEMNQRACATVIGILSPDPVPQHPSCNAPHFVHLVPF